MSEPEFDPDDPDRKLMFDFLADDKKPRQRRRSTDTELAERPLPVIRKPVPVSESGPLLPPGPGAPVEPPPKLTDQDSQELDLDFLDEETVPQRSSSVGAGPAVNVDTASNVTRLDPRTRRSSGRAAVRREVRHTEVRRVHSETDDDGFDEFDSLDFDDSLHLDDDWASEDGVSAGESQDENRGYPGRRRVVAMVLAFCLIAAGITSITFSGRPDWLRLPGFGLPSGSVAESDIRESEGSAAAALREETPTSTVPAFQPSPLMLRFRTELARIEQLVDAGSFDEAEEALETMDRTVYGYGAAEFGAIEMRLAELRSGEGIPGTRAMDEEPATEQVAREEAERRAAEQAARVEAERQAAEQAAREEAERRAAEQAARVGAERQAAEQAAREEAERQAAEQAAREEAERRAAERSARIEAERQVTSATSNGVADSPTSTLQPTGDVDRLATDRRIAEERAAIQRQQARQQRLREAREREVPSSQDQPNSVESVAENASGQQVAESVVASNTPISDEDLQLVYRRFVDLQKAVSDRDINSLVSLTERSGVRVQQFMQLFENSTEIVARIKNVSTSNATGEIKGILQINGIRRANGNLVPPPPGLSLIALSSRRDANGWSAIAW